MSPFEEQAAPNVKPSRAILFADVCKSTQLFEQHGNARALQIVGHALRVLSDLTFQHGGRVVKTIGDEVMSTFPEAPAAAEAARAMQRAIKDDLSLAQLGVRIKIGLHFGEVILEEGDVYGDAVNVAARMTSLTKADQIITTQATVDRFPPEQQRRTRGLGHVRVRGKAHPIEICEVLWHQDPAVLTTIAGPSWKDVQKKDVQKEEEGRLVLEYGPERFVVDPRASSFKMGRGDENNLVIERQSVSRIHATIECSGGYFVLTDCSTNGTYLRMGAEEMFLHRNQVHLLREGAFSLGQALSDDTAALVHYRCE